MRRTARTCFRWVPVRPCLSTPPPPVSAHSVSTSGAMRRYRLRPRETNWWQGAWTSSQPLHLSLLRLLRATGTTEDRTMGDRTAITRTTEDRTTGDPTALDRTRVTIRTMDRHLDLVLE